MIETCEGGLGDADRVGVATRIGVGLTGVGVGATDVGVAEGGVGVRFGIGIWLIEVEVGPTGVGVGVTREVGAKMMEDGSVTVSTRYT